MTLRVSSLPTPARAQGVVKINSRVFALCAVPGRTFARWRPGSEAALGDFMTTIVSPENMQADFANEDHFEF